jgi:NADH:ubiquinone oxidoreductase subunit C
MYAEGWDIYASIKPKHLIGTLFFFKNNSWSRFKVLTDIVAYDRLSGRARFSIIYNLLSLNFRTRIFICISINEGK